MKKIAGFIAIMILLLLFTCTGCAVLSGSGNGLKTQNSLDAQTSDLLNKEGEHYQVNADNLVIDVDMVIPDGLSLTKGTAKLCNFSNVAEAIKNQYVTDDWKEEIEESGIDDDGNSAKTYEWVLGEFPDYSKTIYINPCYMDIRLSLDAYRKKIASLRLVNQDNANEDVYMTGQEFSFMGIRDSLNQVTDELEKVGIPLGKIDYFNCYSLDSETMKKQEYMVDSDGNQIETGYNYKETDNYYQFYARQSFQKLPVYYTENGWGISLSNSCMPIQILAGENGICALALDKIFIFKEDNEKISLLDTDEVIQKVIERYDDLLTKKEYTIHHAELMYYAKKINRGIYMLIPAWVFETVEGKGDDMIYDILIMDAQTGEEVSTE